MTRNGANRIAGRRREIDRRPFTFLLDTDLVERARREVGEPDMVRSIEAALTAAIDYQLWVREVARGRRDALS
ncbi:MAG TPA: hypothetical protein VF158_02095 [Longimicrobiales bacterium]